MSGEDEAPVPFATVLFGPATRDFWSEIDRRDARRRRLGALLVLVLVVAVPTLVALWLVTSR